MKMQTSTLFPQDDFSFEAIIAFPVEITMSGGNVCMCIHSSFQLGENPKGLTLHWK
jgi:hypothetical protein